MKPLLVLVALVITQTLFAQTGGPGQPEYMKFKQADASDLVNPSTGKFSYNIPLFEIGGYPCNLSYESGIQMEDIASIVGLGWNINVGMITHSMRGLPDDFKGDIVKREIFMRKNETFGANVGVGVEITGLPIGGGLSVGGGVFHNTLNGWGIEHNVGLSFSVHNGSKTGSASLGVGMKANTQSGIDLYASPSVGLQSSKNNSLSAGGSLGTTVSINSREGLKSSLNVGMSVSANSKPMGSADESSLSLHSTSGSYSFSKTPEIPRVSYPFKSGGFIGNVKLGGEVWYLHPHGEIGGYYNSQELSTNSVSTPAYGLLYSDAAPNDADVLHDFTREKDQPYVKDASVNIGIPSYTGDIYSVNAQGLSGSFQVQRNDIGVVYDNKIVSSGTSVNVGLEAGFGNSFHAGGAVSVTNTSSQSGKWNTEAASLFNFKSESINRTYESAYFKNASDISVDANNFLQRIGGTSAVKVRLHDPGHWQNEVTTQDLVLVSGNEADRTPFTSAAQITGSLIKELRDPRTTDIRYLTAEEASKFGFERTIVTYPLNKFGCHYQITESPRNTDFRQNWHISEITATTPDGKRYVFGLPTYNKVQKEVVFTLETNQLPNSDGTVTYSPSMQRGQNGKDGFYESTELPPYVTSHLLTSILTPDYVDVDNNGPSINDKGGYVKINYTKAGDFKWRTPYGQNSASFNKALLSDPSDNKGSYVYGEKELWYVHSIVSKTEIAEFHYNTTSRKDGLGVLGESGGKDIQQRPYVLESIKVFSINERSINGNAASPVKVINFTFNNELCPGILNSDDGTSGKLTLKKVSLTSGKSKRGLFSPYSFEYGKMFENGSIVNPSYNPRNVNRWGNYQLNTGTSDINISAPLSNIDHPYVSQDITEMKRNAHAWNLTGITLPNGGKIGIDYEPHAYAYTQNQRSMEMFKIEATGPNGSSTTPHGSLENPDPNGYYYFKIKLKSPIPQNDISQLKFKYFNNDLSQWYYYRTLVNLKTNVHEWITGYFKIADVGFVDNNNAFIKMERVCIGDNIADCNEFVNPIAKSAWQFMRMNRQELCYGSSPSVQGDLFSFLNNFRTLYSQLSDQISAFGRFNTYCMHDKHFASSLDPSKSFIRLYSPQRNKLIGGARVRRIRTDDAWNEQTQGASPGKTYTIDYYYTTKENNPITGVTEEFSSGVSEYEPFNGQDENPLRQPIPLVEQINMAPDNNLYVETPFNETLFPAANLIYSTVRIVNNETTLRVPKTGHTILEFFTSKDYPIKTDLTTLGKNYEKKSDILSTIVAAIFGVGEFHNYVTLSQGASITLNDMHGKPKSTSVFNEQGALVSSERFEYSLGRDLNLINNTGSIYVSNALGTSASAICDSRHTEHNTQVIGANLNVDFAFFGIFPIPMFMPLPNIIMENSRLNTIAFNKIIYQKGIQTKKIVTENGATITMENLLFDDRTGAVPLTRTTNEFEDSIYTFTYPAHWMYEGLGAAYHTSGLSFNVNPTGTGNLTIVDPLIADELRVGDEIGSPSSGRKLWINSKSGNQVEFVTHNRGEGLPSVSYPCVLLRPSRRNKLQNQAGVVVTKKNPMAGDHLEFSKIINTSAQEYSDKREAECDCNDSLSITSFAFGLRGDWEPSKSWAYLANRLPAITASTNLREDGTFNFTPYWTRNSSGWLPSPTGWQWVETMNKRNLNGLVVETRDVLNRHNSLLTGYNNLLVVAEASNARHEEIAFDGFEDWNYIPQIVGFECRDSIKCKPQNLHLNDIFFQDRSEFHTGDYSGRLKRDSAKVKLRVEKKYDMDTNRREDNCLGSFMLTRGSKYVISVWVKDGTPPPVLDYVETGVQVDNQLFRPSGNVIDGWQRIYGEFDVPANAASMNLMFLQGTTSTWFDDLRIFPFSGNMVTHVYDQNTHRLTYSLDENNYFTKYNYDPANNLESINKETEQGVLTINEARTGTAKRQ